LQSTAHKEAGIDRGPDRGHSVLKKRESAVPRDPRCLYVPESIGKIKAKAVMEQTRQKQLEAVNPFGTALKDFEFVKAALPLGRPQDKLSVWRSVDKWLGNMTRKF
jgi:hypothetical protein